MRVKNVTEVKWKWQVECPDCKCVYDDSNAEVDDSGLKGIHPVVDCAICGCKFEVTCIYCRSE